MPFLDEREPARTTFVEVALPVPVRKNFTYKLPADMEKAVKPGARLLVPFGSRVLTGYAVGFSSSLDPRKDVDPSSIKEVLELVDPSPLITTEILSLSKWASDYYLTSWGEVLKASLPAGINSEITHLVEVTPSGRLEMARTADHKALKWRLLSRIGSTAAVGIDELGREFGIAGTKRAVRDLAVAGLVTTRVAAAPAPVKAKRRKSIRLIGDHENASPLTEPQRRVISTLRENQGEMLYSDLLDIADVGASPVNTLLRRGIVEIAAQEIRRDPLEHAELPDVEQHELTEDQQGVFKEIVDGLDDAEFKAFLLHGVTGSGKTEVYIRAMKRALALGKGAMLLVPEIALTPIFSRRLRTVFGQRVAILHSELSAGERFDEWRRIRSGDARIVIGTRSAIFAPVADLGLIIVDEEHDSSYRQSESPFYNARDLAVVRASRNSGIVVLGSATPSMETFHNAHTGKYKYLRLRSRIGERPMAAAELVDMREVFKRAGKEVILSPALVQAIEETHSRGEQSIVLLNRRGFSSFVLCRSCGETLRCINCDITLTYHKRDARVVCHYCNYSVETPRQCPFCESDFLYFIGQGTEQLEDILRKRFPDLRISRIDRDTMRRKGEIERKLLAFDRGEIDMLIGTQMLAKGHDFHNVTLVGVISVDIGLGVPDFRAAERTFQLLTQVAGRAGRGQLPGRVVIQTYHPEHYALRYAVAQDFEGFYRHEVRFRERMNYPPFAALALILIKNADLAKADRYAELLKESLDKTDVNGDCRVLGPADAPIARIKGEHRIQLIIKSGSRKAMHRVIEAAVERAEVYGCDTRSVSIEIDPLNMI